MGKHLVSCFCCVELHKHGALEVLALHVPPHADGLHLAGCAEELGEGVQVGVKRQGLGVDGPARILQILTACVKTQNQRTLLSLGVSMATVPSAVASR